MTIKGDVATLVGAPRLGVIKLDDAAHAFPDVLRSSLSETLRKLSRGMFAGRLVPDQNGVYEWKGLNVPVPPAPPAQQQGPGRRLDPDEEERAAQMFAGGATDRQVAEAIDVGTGTANRLRHRMAVRIAELAQPPLPETLTVTLDPDESKPVRDFTAEDGRRGSLWFFK